MPDGCDEKPKVNAFSGVGRSVTEIVTHGHGGGKERKEGVMD